MFSENCSDMSEILAFSTILAVAISRSRSGMPLIASAMWSISSITPMDSSAASRLTLSPGAFVSLRMAFNMAFRIALAKYFLGYGKSSGR